MQTAKVGIREFRADLAGFIASSTPVAVTRHGQTVGYFIPTQGEQTNALATLHQAGQMLDAMLANPILINRPIVVTPRGVKLCRPSESVLDLLHAH